MKRLLLVWAVWVMILCMATFASVAEGSVGKADTTHSADPITDDLLYGSWTFWYADGAAVCVRFSEDGSFYDQLGYKASWHIAESRLVIGTMVFDCSLQGDVLVLRYGDVSLYLFREPEAPIGRWREESAVDSKLSELWFFENGLFQSGSGLSGIWYMYDASLVIESGETVYAFYLDLADDHLVLLDWVTAMPTASYVRIPDDQTKPEASSESFEGGIAGWYEEAAGWAAQHPQYGPDMYDDEE